MLEQLKKLVKDEEAPTAVEYALMVAGIAVVVIGGAWALGSTTNDALQNVETAVDNRVP
jgi:pilus assembly protein Flp/PilA